MRLTCSCACCSTWVCPLLLIYDTARLSARLRAADKCERSACVARKREGEREGGRAGEREGVCAYMCVKQMSCVLFCSPDWLVFVAAPSCRRAWPRASLSARTNPAHAALICQLQAPSPAPNNSHSLAGPAHSLDDAALLTHTYHAPFFLLPLSPTLLLCVSCATHTRRHTLQDWATRCFLACQCSETHCSLISTLSLSFFFKDKSFPAVPPCTAVTSLEK